MEHCRNAARRVESITVMRGWFWIGIGIGCLIFLEYVVFAGSNVSNVTRWIIYGLIGIGALAKAFPQSNVKSKAERYVQKGYSQQDAGNYSAAERCFNEAL